MLGGRAVMANYKHHSNIRPLNNAGKRVLDYRKGYQQAQMKKDQKVHQIRRIIGWFITAVFLVILSSVCLSHWKSYRTTAAELVRSKQTLQKNKAESKELKEEVKNLHSDTYLQKYIRDKYMYTKDGELVFNLPDEKTNK